MIDPDKINRDIGGVQGDDEPDKAGTGTPEPAEAVDVQSPDAGEIEWAGALVKKAPGAARD